MQTNETWSGTSKIRVMIATDDDELRERLEPYIEKPVHMTLVAVATSAHECIELVKLRKPDVLLISSSMQPERFIDTCREVMQMHPRLALVILMHPDHYDAPNYLHQVLDTGAIPNVMRAEPPYLTLRAQAVIEVITKAHARIQELVNGSGGGSAGQIVSFFSLKGGVGKTTLAANVAWQLAHQGTRARVTLADMNWRFGGLDEYARHTRQRSVLNLLEVLDNVAIRRPDFEMLTVRCTSNLNLLLAPPQEERASYINDLLLHDIWQDPRAHVLDELMAQTDTMSEIRLSSDQAAYLRVLLEKHKIRQLLNTLTRRTLQALRDYNDFAILDTSTQCDDITTAALERSDLIVLVCTPDVPSLRANRAALAFLEQREIKRDKIAYVLNRSARLSDISQTEVSDLFAGYPLLAEIPAGFPEIQPALNMSAFLEDTGRRSPVGRAVANLAQQIVEHLAVPVSA
jgi:pilus assembly protein CpaE